MSYLSLISLMFIALISSTSLGFAASKISPYLPTAHMKHVMGSSKLANVEPFSIPKNLKIDVLANTEDYPDLTEQEIKDTIKIASNGLSLVANAKYSLNNIYFYKDTSEIDPHTTMKDYISNRVAVGAPLPDYIIIFTKAGGTMINGGYRLDAFGESLNSIQVLLESGQNHCNPAGSPYLAPGDIYGTAIVWNPLIGGCGYELQGKDQIHVSSESFGGQCANQSGLQCVFAYGEWQCPNLLNDPKWKPWIENRKLYTAETINHELMHNFGHKGIMDHVCSNDVPEEIIALSAFDICGEVIQTFKYSVNRCVNDPRPFGTVCTNNDQCNESYCYIFAWGNGEVNQCSKVCKSEVDCPLIPGKKAKCLIRDSNYPQTDKSCFYTISDQ